jgi:hypothetical protein
MRPFMFGEVSFFQCECVVGHDGPDEEDCHSVTYRILCTFGYFIRSVILCSD